MVAWTIRGDALNKSCIKSRRAEDEGYVAFQAEGKGSEAREARYSEEPMNTSVVMQIQGPDRRMPLDRKVFGFGVVIWQCPGGKFRVWSQGFQILRGGRTKQSKLRAGPRA